MVWNAFLGAALDDATREHKRRVCQPSIDAINASIETARAEYMRVGPNTDALVWKLCDTNQTVEL